MLLIRISGSSIWVPWLIHKSDVIHGSPIWVTVLMCNEYEWVTSNETCHSRKVSVTWLICNESRNSYEWATSDETCHSRKVSGHLLKLIVTYFQWVTHLIWMSHVIHMSHGTHMNEPCYSYESVAHPYECRDSFNRDILATSHTSLKWVTSFNSWRIHVHTYSYEVKQTAHTRWVMSLT